MTRALTPVGVARLLIRVANSVREPDRAAAWLSDVQQDLQDYVMTETSEGKTLDRETVRYAGFADALSEALEDKQVATGRTGR